MNRGLWTAAGGTAALCAALIAAPGYPAGTPQQEDTVVVAPHVRDFRLAFGDEGGSWLGVETGEVNGDKAKELKLPAERGALIGKVAPDSPASKAGLKENDVVTEINGEHVEGALQFRRLIRETPAGRTVQLSVWHDGRTQSLSVTLGKAEDRDAEVSGALRRGMRSNSFAFRMPDMPDVEIPDLPEVADIPDMPSFDANGNVLIMGRPRLGIDAEDLNGQLGSFFGAPEGEGILVRSVNQGSPAEKAGLKAGDVITSLNGERIRSVGDLRQKLAVSHSKRDDKDKDAKERIVKLGLLRNKSEVSVSVEVPETHTTKSTHLVTRRTNI